MHTCKVNEAETLGCFGRSSDSWEPATQFDVIIPMATTSEYSVSQCLPIVKSSGHPGFQSVLSHFITPHQIMLLIPPRCSVLVKASLFFFGF